MDEVFRALADPSRRRLLDSLNARGGQTLRELCEGQVTARQSVSKHLTVLEDAGLITTMWRGREKLHHLNAAPINDLADRWIHQYDRPRAEALADLKLALEERPVPPEFVYTTYIRTTPERLWRALTEPAFTRRYWLGMTFESDWTPGADLTFTYHHGVRIADPAQVVLEADPFRRLSYTWHSFTPEWAQANGTSEQARAGLAAEQRSKVTFELEDVGAKVRLTVVHDDLDPGGRVLESIRGGWPIVLSDLKTLLETGDLVDAAS